MTALEMIKKFAITLPSNNPGMLQINNVAEGKRYREAIAKAKPEILAILTAEKEAKERAYAERKAKIEAIEGLAELEAANAALEHYHYEFERAMDRGDGVFPTRPTVDPAELRKAYPRAAAYVKADAWTRAAHYAKVSAGEKALEKIINGEDHEAAIAAMETEFSDYCTAHIWD